MTFNPPTNCPECDSDLVWKKDQLYCINVECPAQQSKQVEHFAKTLKIKGLGPATVKTLDLKSIPEIYSSDLSNMASDKMREKLSEEIANSLKHPLNNVLPAMGIPLVGKSATNKLSVVCNSIFDINEETCRQAGLGEKTTNNLLDWLSTNLDWFLEIPFDFEFRKEKAADKGTVCITGRLQSYKTKAEATKYLEEAGYKVVSSITKAVTHLVNESGKSTAKTEKAEASGVIIVNNIKELTENTI